MKVKQSLAPVKVKLICQSLDRKLVELGQLFEEINQGKWSGFTEPKHELKVYESARSYQ